MAEPNLADARVTIHLPGDLRPGDIVPVDLNNDYIQMCLTAGFLVLRSQDAAGAAVGSPVDTAPAPTATDDGSGGSGGQYRKQDDPA